MPASCGAAEQSEDVPVARVAAGHPHAVLTRDAADDRQEVHDEAEQPRPAVVDSQRTADQLGDERRQRSLDRRRGRLVGRELLVQRRVAEAAGEDPAVGRLLPVVEPVPAVVREVEEPLRDRLGRDHLTSGGDDQTLDLAE
jgi:hypothetical protein